MVSVVNFSNGEGVDSLLFASGEAVVDDRYLPYNQPHASHDGTLVKEDLLVEFVSPTAFVVMYILVIQVFKVMFIRYHW